MTVDWYPGIRECCAYWSDAAMMQQTFAALEKAFAEENDACIDCAKSMVEVVCRAIVEELDDPLNPQKPVEDNPPFAKWVTAAVRVLKLGDTRDKAFSKLISQHHKLTETLGALRNGAGPVSHGRDAFLERLSSYHRRAAILSADAIVAFLHQAYLEAEVKLEQTRLPYERFRTLHASIDRWAELDLDRDSNGQYYINITIGDEAFSLILDVSRILFAFDRTAYVEALRAAQQLESQAADVETMEPASAILNAIQAVHQAPATLVGEIGDD